MKSQLFVYAHGMKKKLFMPCGSRIRYETATHALGGAALSACALLVLRFSFRVEKHPFAGNVGVL